MDSNIELLTEKVNLLIEKVDLLIDSERVDQKNDKKQKQKEYHRQWYLKNKEKQKQKHQEWYESNKKRERERARRMYYKSKGLTDPEVELIIQRGY